MLANTVCLSNPIPGLERYSITLYGHVPTILPDVMRVRYYSRGRQYTHNTWKLPKVLDNVEYDYRVNEWFIIRK